MNPDQAQISPASKPPSPPESCARFAQEQTAKNIAATKETANLTFTVAFRERRFEGYTVQTALYGTGWEGTVALEESSHGTWKAFTER